MCILSGSRIFVRVDSNAMIEKILNDINKSRVSPAQHMNYDGLNTYRDSGYLSLFEYRPDQSTWSYDYQKAFQSAAFALSSVLGEYIHFLFIPSSVQEIALSEKTVRQLPETGRTPTLYNTDKCSPPSKRGEDGEILEYANRDINEYLYTGAWAKGMMVITERKNNSYLKDLMSKYTKVDYLTELCQAKFPCPKDDDPSPPPSGGSSNVAMECM